MEHKGVRVTLDGSEYLAAMHTGIMRAAIARKRGLKNAHGVKPGMSEAAHVCGAVGEAMVAKHFGLWWCGVGRLGGDDVANVQVRTRTEAGRQLMLHKRDSDEAVFIAVFAQEGAGIIRGWILGRDGKRPEFWMDPAGGRPAYFVPDKELRPIDELQVVDGEIRAVSGGLHFETRGNHAGK